MWLEWHVQGCEGEEMTGQGRQAILHRLDRGVYAE